jgi:F-type H+-transporting ATPase subunit b
MVLMTGRVRQACASRRPSRALAGLALTAALAAVLCAPSLPTRAAGLFVPTLDASMRQQPPAGEHAPEGAAEGQAAEDTEGGGGLMMMLGKIVNSALLVGTLVYFLRAPVTQYLDDRMTQVRQELMSAADMRAAASAELEKIAQRLVALPGDIDALRSRGAQELAAEEARIRQATKMLRERLLGQTRREIDLQAKMAEGELLGHAAEIAVNLAAERIRRHVTDEDQLRLIDAYVEHVTARS